MTDQRRPMDAERRKHEYHRVDLECGRCWCGATVTSSDLVRDSKTHDDLCRREESDGR